MRILVVGGTYFLGKAFVELACEKHQILMVNRGSRNVSFSYPAHVQQVTADRHQITRKTWETLDLNTVWNFNSGKDLDKEEIDVVVDFCAYQKGDIRQVVESLPWKVKQYIFVSTCDVYKRGAGKSIDENGELEDKDWGGDAGKYILGKVALEKELQEVATEFGMAVNAIRPGFIYGPGNYALREDLFFQWVEQAGQVLFPVDADGFFYMVHVEDVATAILTVCEKEACKNKAFNVLGNGTITYVSFLEALRYAMCREFEPVEITVQEIIDRSIMLPFPLTKEESETYCSQYENLLGIEYRSLEEGLRATYQLQMEQALLPTIDAFFENNDAKGAENYMLRVKEGAYKIGHFSLALAACNELIGYYRQTSNKERLLETIAESFALLHKRGEQTSLTYATVVLNAANGYRSLGMFEDAVKLYDTTEKLYEELIAQGKLLKQDLLVAGFYNNRSLLCQELGEYEAAERYQQKALKIVDVLQAGFEIAVTYANLANTNVLLKRYGKAKEYAHIAIRLFKARACIDAHYCAALSALASCYLEEGAYSRAITIWQEALQIVDSTIGKNSQYERIRGNLIEAHLRMGEGGAAHMKGMELSRKYYEAYGAPMLHEQFPTYEDQIAVGLVGEGSECFGFDDALSTDHDFGPEFCMWITEEVDAKIGEALREAYNKLPETFAGYTRNVTNGGGRRGVQVIPAFYEKYLGTSKPEEIDYANVEDYALAACTNGEVFRDDAGYFSAIRKKLGKGYPERVRFLKIAQAAARFSQNAQYNYSRMLEREDEVTAQIVLAEGLKEVMKLCHYLSEVYPPHDKWLYHSLKQIPGMGEIVGLVDKVNAQYITKTDKRDVKEAIDELGSCLAKRMYDASIISDIDNYLDYHTEEILFKAQYVALESATLVEAIVKLEFEAFDKVKNEGGRAYCQNDWPTFSVMRKSQYLTWNHTMLLQYYYDFSRQYRMGHNLITEKYGRMMESTAPDRWQEIKDNFPQLTEEKKAIIEQIVALQMQMMEEFAKEHPKTAGNARSLHTYEDNIINTSYETYLRGEVSTYSDKMLQLYGQYVVEAIKNGVNIAYITMDNTARLYGYKNIEEFEKDS